MRATSCWHDGGTLARQHDKVHSRCGEATAARGAQLVKQAPTAIMSEAPIAARHPASATCWRSPAHLSRSCGALVSVLRLGARCRMHARKVMRRATASASTRASETPHENNLQDKLQTLKCTCACACACALSASGMLLRVATMSSSKTTAGSSAVSCGTRRMGP